jgi:inosine-uridine nucleoside N-ribohydrolase
MTAKTLISQDLCTQASFTDREMDMLKARDSAFSHYLIEKITPWLELNKKVFRKNKGFYPWDVVAAAYLIDPTLFDSVPQIVEIAESGWRGGRFLSMKVQSDFSAVDGKLPVNIPGRLDREGFMKIFMDGMLHF